MPTPANPQLRSQLQPGDIIAFYGRDWRSLLIQWATFGPSHVGIICDWDSIEQRGNVAFGMVMVECTTMCNHYCLHSAKLVEGVQVQWPEARIADYGNRATLFRLRPERRLSPQQSRTLTTFLRNRIGTAYNFAGALWSGTRLLKHLLRWTYSDGGSLFCSELIAEALIELEHLPISNPADYNPGNLIRTLVSCRRYQRGIAL